MTTLHLVRHGETDWNAAGKLQGRRNSELTARGKMQAARLAEQLLRYSFHKIISSSSKRAVQTAQILADRLGLPVMETDALWEINLGPWEGRLKIEIKKENPVEFDHFWNKPDHFALPGAETFEQLQRRGLAAIRNIVAEYHEQRVLVVSHGAMIKSILSHFDGRPLCNLWQPPELHNCAHSIVEFAADGGHLIRQFAGCNTW